MGGGGGGAQNLSSLERTYSGYGFAVSAHIAPRGDGLSCASADLVGGSSPRGSLLSHPGGREGRKEGKREGRKEGRKGRKIIYQKCSK